MVTLKSDLFYKKKINISSKRGFLSEWYTWSKSSFFKVKGSFQTFYWYITMKKLCLYWLFQDHYTMHNSQSHIILIWRTSSANQWSRWKTTTCKLGSLKLEPRQGTTISMLRQSTDHHKIENCYTAAEALYTRKPRPESEITNENKFRSSVLRKKNRLFSWDH